MNVRERNSCSCCGLVAFMEREGVELQFFESSCSSCQKWVLGIVIKLRDRLKFAEFLQ